MNGISRLLLGTLVLGAACQGNPERSPEETAAIDFDGHAFLPEIALPARMRTVIRRNMARSFAGFNPRTTASS